MSSFARAQNLATPALVALLLAGCGGIAGCGGTAASADDHGTVAPGHVTLLSTKECVRDFTVDGSSLYFTTPTSVYSMAKTGGTPTAITTTQGDAAQIAVSGENVYWMDEDAQYQGHMLMSAPLAGGQATTRSSVLLSMTASAAGLFFVDGSEVMAVPGGGSSDAVLAPGNFGALAADAQSVYALSYGTDAPTYTMVRIPVTGGAPVPLGPIPDTAGAPFVTDGAYVYWVDGATSDLTRMPVGGGTPSTFASAGACPTSLAVDGTSVYWVDHCSATGSAVLKAPVTGGGPVVVASSSDDGGGTIVVDDTSLYWLTGSCNATQTIEKTTPK